MYSGFSGESFASASQSRTARSSEASSSRFVTRRRDTFSEHTGDANVRIFGRTRRRHAIDRGARKPMHAGVDVHARVVGFREAQNLVAEARDSSESSSLFVCCFASRFSLCRVNDVDVAEQCTRDTRAKRRSVASAVLSRRSAPSPACTCSCRRSSPANSRSPACAPDRRRREACAFACRP